MTAPSTPRRAAVSTLSAALVHGPVRSAGVVASSRLGCYLLLDPLGAREDGPVLPVLTPAALALPTAVQLADAEAPVLEVGDRAEVGEGRITAPGTRIDVVRTFRPARVRRCAAAARPGPTSRDGSSPDPGAEPKQEPSVGEGSGDRTVLRALLQTRLGLGAGLTPEGDDEIAGHLLVAAATGGWVPDLEPHLHRTTALSASLLRAAAQGYAVPAVVAYVDAVLANDHLTAARLRPTIEAIGHSSGPALLRGIHAAAQLHESHPSALPHRGAGADLHERTVA